MATWEEFKKKMFKKNKNFERDFKETERRMKTKNYFEDLKRSKNSLSEVGLPAEVEVEVLKTYAIAKTKRMIRYKRKKRVDVIDYLTEKQEN